MAAFYSVTCVVAVLMHVTGIGAPDTVDLPMRAMASAVAHLQDDEEDPPTAIEILRARERRLAEQIEEMQRTGAFETDASGMIPMRAVRQPGKPYIGAASRS